MAGKSKIIQTPSLVETFPNIIQQFEIDVDATHITLIKKTSCSLFFSFLKKYSLTSCLTLKTI